MSTVAKKAMISGQEVHPNLTLERIMDAVEESYSSLDNPGFCIACGEDAYGVEPDAEEYPCDSCGEPQVYGAEQLVLLLA